MSRSYDSPPPFPRQNQINTEALKNLLGMSFGAAFIIFGSIFLFLFIWFGCRIEPRADQIAILIKKTGDNLPSGEIIAQSPAQKGVQLAVFSEGRYFKNPYSWGWKIAKIQDIPAGQLGVITRLYGKDLPPGQIMATGKIDDKSTNVTKGILEDVLQPGKHRINPFAYSVKIVNAISIPPGHVGVVRSMVGQDVFTADLAAEKLNSFLVGKDMKGVIPEVLDPGTYYLNPYMIDVLPVNLQSQRFEMSGEDSIVFLTADGFTVTVEGTLEFAVTRNKAAEITHRVGDMDDIIKKIVMPRARGFSRIEGSKHPAIDFIVGQTRQKFQNELELHLRDKCTEWGVEMRSVLVRRIIVPDQIASINRDREVAVQEAKKYDQQMLQAKSKAELTKQEMLAVQNKEKVEADTLRIRAKIGVEQEQAVQIIAAEKDLQVAKINLTAAKAQAEAVIFRAEGDRDAVKAQNEAEAAVITSQVRAFESGMNLARYTFYQKVAPMVNSVLTSDTKEGLGTIFSSYLPNTKEVSK